MPVFMVTAPDGRKLRVTAPEGATEQDAIEYAKRQLGGAPAQPTGVNASQALSGGASATGRLPVSGGADASALAAAPTGEYDPRTSGANVNTALAALLAGNPATAPAMIGGLLGASRSTGGASLEPLRRQGANILSLLSNDEGDQALAAQATGAKVIDHPTFGKVAVLPDGTVEYVNAPGLTMRSGERAIAQIAPFLGGPATRAGATAAQRFGSGFLRAAAGGALREAVEAPARATAGGEQNLGQTAADITLDAVTGGVGEAVFTPLLRLGASAIQRLRGVDKWSKESVAAALSKEGLPPETIDAVWRAGRQGQDPQQILRLVEAQQVNAPLPRGQVTGNADELAQLRALLAQSGDGGAGSAMARGAIEGTDTALAAEAQRIRDAAGVDPTKVGAAGGESLMGRLTAQREAAEGAVREAYAKVPEDAVINPRAFGAREYSADGKAIRDALGEFWTENKDFAPGVAKIMRSFAEKTKKNEPIGLREFEAVRRQFSTIAGTSANGPDRAAASKALALMNNVEEFVSQTGNVYSASGPNAASLLRDARRARRTLGEQFENTYDFKNGREADDIISRLTSGQMEPQQVMDKLLGSSGGLNPKRANFTKDVQRLAEFDPQGFQTVRFEAVNRAVEQVMMTKSDDALAQVLKNLRENKKALGSLIDEQQFNEIFRLARVRRAALAGRSGKTAPLPDKNFVSRMATAVFATGATTAGLTPIMGPVGAFGTALAAGGAVGNLMKRRALKKTAERIALPPTAQQLPGAVPGVDARLTPGILDFLRGENE